MATTTAAAPMSAPMAMAPVGRAAAGLLEWGVARDEAEACAPVEMDARAEVMDEATEPVAVGSWLESSEILLSAAELMELMAAESEAVAELTLEPASDAMDEAMLPVSIVLTMLWACMCDILVSFWRLARRTKEFRE